MPAWPLWRSGGHADEGALRAEQVGQETLIAYALALRALAEAYRGNADSARSVAAQALALADSTSGRPAEHFATAAVGLLELSLGRNAQAADVLTPLVSFARQQELREPGLTRFVPDLVEALVACERLEEAEDHLAWFETNAERLERASGQGAAARCRGFLAAGRGDLPGAISAFERALRHHDLAPLPLDRARTLLALGVARRRANDRSQARATLEEARGLFGSLGAAIWEQRAVEELARIGGRAPAGAALTPVERRVVELVAAGHTNREVAAALFLSPRTVEGHLSRVYGKLGVRSRVELVSRLGSEAREQSRVVPRFFAQTPPPSVEASLDEPDQGSGEEADRMKIRTTFALAAAALTLGVPVAVADPDGYQPDAIDRYVGNALGGRPTRPDALARYLRNHPSGAARPSGARSPHAPT